MPPKSSRYQVLTASATVRQCLKKAGMAVDDAEVIYPGARVDLFGAARLGRPLPPAPNGTAEAATGVLRRSANGKQRTTHIA